MWIIFQILLLINYLIPINYVLFRNYFKQIKNKLFTIHLEIFNVKYFPSAYGTYFVVT